MMHDGLYTDPTPGPRFRPWFDEKKGIWVGRKIVDIEAEEAEEKLQKYIAATEALIRSQALLERTLSESTHKKLATPQVLKALKAVRQAAVTAEHCFPHWLIDQ